LHGAFRRATFAVNVNDALDRLDESCESNVG
jgi:hypothetical protein